MKLSKRFNYLSGTIALLLFTICSYTILSTPFNRKYKYNISIATIFRDDAPYLKEWIEYHLLIGVDHFYLYNHLSQDNPEKVLKPYIDSGIVDLIYTNEPFWKSKFLKPHKKYNNAQLRAYHDATRRAQFISKWVAYIDTDEFISIADVEPLPEFLKQYEDYGGLIINWRLFGTSNINKIPNNRLLTETLTWRNNSVRGKDYDHVKTIARPERISKFRIHYFSYHHPYVCVKPDHSLLNPNHANLLGGPIDKIKLNHYYFRDKQFFEDIKLARLKDRYNENSQKIIENLRDMELDTYEVQDFSIYPLLSELKKRMNKNKIDLESS